MTSNQIKQISELAAVDNEILDLEKQLDKLNKHRRALINNNNLNKWPTDDHINAVGQNGEHY
jgi:hypothetical protein